MKIYKVAYYIEHGQSAGFGFFPTLAEAHQAIQSHLEDNPDNGADAKHTVHSVTLTRAGMLHALATHASHPDNG